MIRPLSTPFGVKFMNRLASVLFMVFALLVLGLAAGWVVRHPMFAIGGMVVTGEVTHNNVVTLQANVMHRLSGTFLTMDLALARSAFETAPWVRQAVVRREFPNRLKITLQEHKAVAYWGGEGESRLVNSFGEVFEANLGELEDEVMPRLNGPEGQAAQILATYYALQPLFEDRDTAIEQLDLSPRGGWRVLLDTDASLELGGGSTAEVLARTQRFLSTVSQVTARYGRQLEALETADLRHENGYAIRLRGVTTLALNVDKK